MKVVYCKNYTVLKDYISFLAEVFRQNKILKGRSLPPEEVDPYKYDKRLDTEIGKPEQLAKDWW